MALSLAAKHLQIAVHQVLPADPAVDRAPAGQLQLTRGTGDLLRRPRHPKFFLYVVHYLPGMKHPAVAIRTPQQILLLRCMRVIGRYVIHMCAVSPYFPRYCTHVSPNQPSNLPLTQSVYIIFPYTAPFFYGKMMVVHTVPSGGLVVWQLHSTRVLYELLLFP